MAGLIGTFVLKGETVADLDRPLRHFVRAGDEIIQKHRAGAVSVAQVLLPFQGRRPCCACDEESGTTLWLEGEIFGWQEEACSQNLSHEELSAADYCLRLYLKQGTRAFARLNGSFFLVIFCEQPKGLLLVTDRFATLPLYWTKLPGAVFFATRVLALASLPGVSRELDRQAVYELMAFQRTFGDRTLLSAVRAVAPGSVLRFDAQGRVRATRYWAPSYPTDSSRGAEEFAEDLAHRIKKAIAIRTADDARYGSFLSGGLDSRMILAAADVDLTAFSIVQSENLEFVITKKVAEVQGVELVLLRRSFDHYARLLDEAVEITEGMHRFDHCHFLGLLDAVRQRVDVVLNGHALDYRFQGYYLPLRWLRLFGRSKPTWMLAPLTFEGLQPAWKWYLEHSAFPFGPERFLRADLRQEFQRYIDDLLADIRDEARGHGISDPYNAFDYLLIHSESKHWAFPNLYCVRDYVLERTVGYDAGLFDLYQTMPPRLRARGRVYRRALQILSPRLGRITNANTGLPGSLSPKSEFALVLGRALLRNLRLLQRPKVEHPALSTGSWPEMSELIRFDENLQQRLRSTFADSEALPEELFDRGFLNHALQAHLGRRGDFWAPLLVLLTMGRWVQKLNALGGPIPAERSAGSLPRRVEAPGCEDWQNGRRQGLR